METLSTHAPLRLRRPRSFLRAALAWLIQADEGYRQKVAFDRLDDHMRRDIGLIDAAVPTHRTWDAPRVMRQP